MTTKTDERVRSDDPTAKLRKPLQNQVWINKQIHCEFLDMEKHVAWDDGRMLDQVIFRATDDGWMCILKAWRGHTAWVAFIYARTLAESIELAGEFASRGVLTWLKDKYPSKRVKSWEEGI